MNVLFFLFQKIDATSEVIGGIERHTLLLCKELSKKGFNFFFSYSHTDDYLMLHPELSKANVYDSEYELRITKNTTLEEVRKFLVNKQINVIHIQQNDGFEAKLFRNAVKNLPIKIVATYHFCPGYELNDLNVKNSLLRFKQEQKFGKKIKWLKRLTLMPYYRIKKSKDMVKKFETLYNNVDTLVLLSNGYIPLFNKLCAISSQDEGRKLTYINNCVTFEEFLDVDKILQKRKEIVVVARLEEAYKRISIAINLWKKIAASGKFDDWSMTIVGDGYSYDSYQKQIEDVPNITMVGRQPSSSYFRRSSIYLNTSINEGWCLCCNEAMQMGTIPFSFDTWPAVFDIIDDNENGFIIADGNLDDYYKKLTAVMENDRIRHNMAIAAINKSKNFTKEKFIQEYFELYTSTK